MNAEVKSRSNTATLSERKRSAARMKTCAAAPVRRAWGPHTTDAVASRKKSMRISRARVPSTASSAKWKSARVISAMEEAVTMGRD